MPANIRSVAWISIYAVKFPCWRSIRQLYHVTCQNETTEGLLLDIDHDMRIPCKEVVKPIHERVRTPTLFPPWVEGGPNVLREGTIGSSPSSTPICLSPLLSFFLDYGYICIIRQGYYKKYVGA